MNVSLSKFCKDTGLPKSSVYSRCKELNFDVANGLTSAMVATLENEFGVSAPGVGAVRPEVLPKGFFQTSSLAPVEKHEIQLPPGFDPAAMVKFFDGVAGQNSTHATFIALLGSS